MPPGKIVVVMDGPAATVMESEVVVALRWFGLVESVTVILRLLVPVAVGVPEMAPAEFIVRPAGRPLTDHV